MSDGNIGMNFRDMAAIIDDLKRYTGQIREWVTTLETNSEKSLASWDGDAKTQYSQEKQIWNDAIGEMEQGLGMHGNALINIHETTFRGEMRNTDRWVGQGKPY
jgi:WXG100 family type VII secretion target